MLPTRLYIKTTIKCQVYIRRNNEGGDQPFKGVLSRQISLPGNETGVKPPCIAQGWSDFMTAGIQWSLESKLDGLFLESIFCERKFW